MEALFHQLEGGFQPIITRLLDEPLLSLEELEHAVVAYTQELRARTSASEFLDTQTALTLSRDCIDLIRNVAGNYSPKRHRIVQVAVRYFVLDPDLESDATSIIGFDDDVEVVNLAKDYLTRKSP